MRRVPTPPVMALELIRTSPANLPAAATTTMSPTTNGELAKPHIETFVLLSDATLRDHTTAPLLASSAFRIPVAPNVYTRPLLRVGVARGPAPPFDSQNRTASRWRHSGWPVVIL